MRRAFLFLCFVVLAGVVLREGASLLVEVLDDVVGSYPIREIAPLLTVRAVVALLSPFFVAVVFWWFALGQSQWFRSRRFWRAGASVAVITGCLALLLHAHSTQPIPLVIIALDEGWPPLADSDDGANDGEACCYFCSSGFVDIGYGPESCPVGHYEFFPATPANGRDLFLRCPTSRLKQQPATGVMAYDGHPCPPQPS